MPNTRINHLSVARKYMEKANKLNQLLQSKGLSKSHADYQKLKRFKQRAEIHMAQHKDISEFTAFSTSRNPYLTNEGEEKEPVKSFKEFSKKKEKDEEDDEEETARNESGKKMMKLSGKKDKVIINPQMRTIQVNLPGGQTKNQ